MGSIHSRSIFFKNQRDQFAHGWSFSKKKLTRVNQSHQSLKKIEEQRSKRAIFSFDIKGGKTIKNLPKICFFGANGLFFESICFCQSFSKINKRFAMDDCLKDQQNDSITVDLFKRSTRAIWSRSIFLKDWREQFDHRWSFSKIEKIKILKKTLLFIFLGIPSCLGDAIKQKEKERNEKEANKKKIKWTAVHRNCKICVYYTDLC